MMLKPLRAGVLLKPQEAAQQNVAGLIIANAAVYEAVVVDVGPDVKELKAGDVVRYDEKAAVKVDKLLLCREADVLCVVEG